MPATLRERWEALPAAARWPLTYLATVALAALVGWPTIGVGDAIFLAGAAALTWSLTYIRLGGPKARIGRDAQTGRPLFGHDPAAREAEIRKGLAVFAFALALWAPLTILAFMR